ncbi:MAG: helix-turn-helix domain-containing protein [Gammaproteobacteria bacterium]
MFDEAARLQSTYRPDLYLADSTLFYVLLCEFLHSDGARGRLGSIERYLAFADPTQRIAVPGELFVEMCMRLYDAWGPENVFRALSNAFVEQWTPVSTVFATAQDPARIAERLQAFERLAGRSCLSEIAVASDNAVAIRRLLIRRDLACTDFMSLAYWAYVVSAFRAAGCRGIRVETRSCLLLTDRHVNVADLTSVPDSQSARLSWEERNTNTQPSHQGPRFRVARHDRLVSDLVGLLQRSIAAGRQTSLSEAAVAVHRSRRSLQRRLREANVSFLGLRLALQLLIASRALADVERDLDDIAISADFTDAPHMIRRFLQATGMTPREFNRRLMF